MSNAREEPDCPARLGRELLQLARLNLAAFRPPASAALYFASGRDGRARRKQGCDGEAEESPDSDGIKRMRGWRLRQDSNLRPAA